MAEQKLLYTVEMAGQKAALDELAKLRKETEELKRENQSYNRSLKAGADMSKETARESERTTIAIKEKRKRMSELTKEIENNGKSSEKMRTRLTAMRQEMQRMRVAGQQNTKQYQELRKATGQLDDQITQVSREIKVFADDAMVMNTVVDSAKGMAQGFQLVQSAQALLGFESEKFQEVMQKLVATQTLINSLQGVQNTLMKKSRVMIVGKVAAVKVATAVQWAWNKAMAANPIGAIVVVVAALTAGIWALSKALKRTKEDTDSLTDSNNALIRSYEIKEKSLEFEIQMMNALGISKEKVNEKTKELLKTELARMELSEQQARIDHAAGKITLEQRLEIINATTEANRRYQLFIATQIRLDQERRAKENEDANNRIELERQKNDKLIADEQRRADEQEKIRQQEIERLQQQMEDELNRAEMAQAELNLLLNDSLENRIALETVKHQQLMESRQDWTREEIALMKERHRQTIAELQRQHEQESAIAHEGAKVIQKTEQVKAEAVAATLASTADSLGASAHMQSIFAAFTKAIALTETIVNISKGTAQNASAAPFPANIGLIAGFLAQVGGLIGTISAIQPPSPPTFAKGGIIEGRSHAQGGTVFQGTDGSVFEAEKGEYLAIVNKRDAARAQMLDEINQTHGKKFKNGGTFFAKGGVFSPRQDLQRMNIEDIVQETVEKITHIPVILVERDVTTTQEKVRRIRVAGDL